MNEPLQDITDQTSQNVPNNQMSTKKKKSSNWSSAEEVLLAEAWVHISQQPEFGTNQSGETFFKRVTEQLNSKSSFDDRDVNSVQIKWAALKTATLKFSGYYSQIEREPPSGTVETDWPELAIKLYNELNPKKPPFKSLAAWKILSTAPKWIVPRPPPGPLAMAIAKGPSNDPFSDSTEATSRPSTPPRPIGTKQSKRKRKEEEKAEELKAARDDILRRSNELAERRVQALEEGNEVVKQMAKADAEAKASLVQVNELKVLMMSEDSCQTEVAKEVLHMMQQRLKDKYKTADTSSSSNSNDNA